MPNAEQVFEAALERVQSKSIQAWARSEHNRPIWLAEIQTWLDAKAEIDPVRVATLITVTAMG